MKKQYIFPLIEVTPIQAAIGIMKTSIPPDISEPGSSGSGAPRRRTEVF